jgi:hypothetical protein
MEAAEKIRVTDCHDFVEKTSTGMKKGRRASQNGPLSHFSASSGLKYNLCGIDGFSEVFLSFISGHLVRPWGRADQRPDAGHQTPQLLGRLFYEPRRDGLLFSHEHQRAYSRLIRLFSRRFLTLCAMPACAGDAPYNFGAA